MGHVHTTTRFWNDHSKTLGDLPVPCGVGQIMEQLAVRQGVDRTNHQPLMCEWFGGNATSYLHQIVV